MLEGRAEMAKARGGTTRRTVNVDREEAMVRAVQPDTAEPESDGIESGLGICITSGEWLGTLVERLDTRIQSAVVPEAEVAAGGEGVPARVESPLRGQLAGHNANLQRIGRRLSDIIDRVDL